MARLYVIRGQSNARGAAPNADCHPSLSGAMTSVKMFNGTSFANFDVGVNQNYPTTDTYHGILPAFLYNEQIRLNETIYCVNYGVGGTKLNDDGTTNCWYPGRAGALWDKSISVVNAAMAEMWNTHGVRSIDVVEIWLQGESDTVLSADSSAYETNLNNGITKSRNNYSGTSFGSLYWVFVLLGTDTSYDATRLGEVNSAMQAIAADEPSTRWTYDPTGTTLQVDLHHREASGYKAIGEGIVNTIMPNT